MLLFVFVGTLFKLTVNTPSLEPLFQLPPRRKAPLFFRSNPPLVRQIIAGLGNYASNKADKPTAASKLIRTVEHLKFNI